MAKPDTIADLRTAKQTQVDLITGDLQEAKLSKVVFLPLIDDQSARALPGVNSFVLHDSVEPTIEDTTSAGVEQSDLRGEVVPTTLTIDKYKTVPGYFDYILGENERVGWLENFLREAPKVAALDVEGAAIDAAIAIGATVGNYQQLGAADLLGTANAAIDEGNMAFGINKLSQEDKIDIDNLMMVMSITQANSAPKTLFDLYTGASSSNMADEARKKGFIGDAMGIPFYRSSVLLEKAIMFSKKSVAFAMRTEAVDSEPQASKARDYYGVRISYGVVARSTLEAVVFGRGVAHDATR